MTTRHFSAEPAAREYSKTEGWAETLRPTRWLRASRGGAALTDEAAVQVRRAR